MASTISPMHRKSSKAEITTRVDPPRLRHAVVTTRCARGMPSARRQTFLGYAPRETPPLSAESSTAMMRESDQRARSQ
jgi:hypothetical protein